MLTLGEWLDDEGDDGFSLAALHQTYLIQLLDLVLQLNNESPRGD